MITTLAVMAHAGHSYGMIVLGTYTQESTAKEAKAWLEDAFMHDEDLQAIRFSVKPSLQLTKGNKYYSVSLRPFENEVDALQVLPVAQRYRKDAFVATYTQADPIDFSYEKAPLKQPANPVQPNTLPVNDSLLLYVSLVIAALLFVMLLLTMRRNRALIKENWQLEKECSAMLANLEVKDAFLSRLEEELKGPLSIIYGYTNVIAGTSLDTKQAAHLEKVRHSIDVLSNTLDDMTTYAKIERNEFEITNETFNLNAVLNNLSTILGAVAFEKNVELIFDLDKNVPAKITGDAVHLDEVLRNLVRFALNNTTKGGVNVRIRRLPSREKHFKMEYAITDTSGGMDLDALKKLNDGSLSANSLKADHQKEWGILAARKIVEKMGGVLEVTSKLGEGSNFRFILESPIPAEFDRRQYRLPSKSTMNKRVLIADANLEAAKSLDKMVAYFHHQAEITSSLDGVVRNLRDKEYDIIYIDARLVEQDRTNTILVIRQNSDAKLVMVGNYLVPSVENGRHGIDLHMKKPFNYQDVFDTIVELYADEVAKEENVKVYTKEDLQNFSGANILLAEDNQVNQSIIDNLLEGTGINLIVANNGEEAIDYLIKHENVDLIIMDIDMPVMDGYETARKIRENVRFHDIPIIALTAQVKPEDVERAKRAGMQEHIGKPYKMVSLYNNLYKYLMVSKYLPKKKKQTA
jgi:CheY-like chemotaxis protein/signal transduction histidine kinase